MEAGKLRHEIVIQQKSETRNTTGDVLFSWSTYLSTYAECKNLSMNELLQAHQVNSKITTKFIIRWDSGVRANMRILYRSRAYNIVGIDNFEERDIYQILLCERLEDITNG